MDRRLSGDWLRGVLAALGVACCFWAVDSGGATPDLIINEIHSDPPVKTDLAEFIELYNRAGEGVDLSGWAIRGGIDYRFPDGTFLDSGDYLVVGQSPEKIEDKFGLLPLGPFEGRIANEGECIRVEDAEGETVHEVCYGLGFPWPTVGDPPAASLELIHPDLDPRLPGNWRSSRPGEGPTPGRQSSVYSTDRPPQFHDVSHRPEQPESGDAVEITALVTAEEGIADVELAYQVVQPGSYFSQEDLQFEAGWTTQPMQPAGDENDQAEGPRFTVELPGSLHDHRHLIRYRIRATDRAGNEVRVPYPDDPQPNFAYFVYDGVPGWEGAIEPGSSDPERSRVVEYGPEVMRQLPVYHLLADREEVEEAQFTEQYRGSDYKWEGTLVYDGEVYDHVRFRARGGVWRYAMGKNMWKFDFLRGHHFRARDDYGQPYDTLWDKLNFSAIIQQGNFGHRGEQGMFEAVGFKLFNLVGVEGPKTHWVQFRVIDEAEEAGETQYDGDLWGMYLVVEQPDGRLLDEHGLPDGNFYKMEGGTGEKNNQGPTAAPDKSDLNAFLTTYRATNPSEEWWRANLDLQRYYSYRAIVEAIHHYDIGAGKNYFYYLHPETGRWSVHPWDLDLTWADNMFGDGNEPFKSRVLSRPVFRQEYQNRLREIRDVLINRDEAWRLIDEMAAIIDDPEGGPSMVDVDRAMWDYNPIMASDWVNPSKSGQGRFYEATFTRDFPGMVRKMKGYISQRMEWIDNNLLDESQIPDTPEIEFVGSSEFAVDDLTFRCSPFTAGEAPFHAMEWRLAEVTLPEAMVADREEPGRYEIESDWESGFLTEYRPEMTVPANAAEPGRAYRARVRMQDEAGWWSHWSEPVEFVAQAASETSRLRSDLVLTELMYHPSEDEEWEYVELHNRGESPLDLTGVQLTEGLDFTFPAGAEVDPGETFLVVRADPTGDFADFRSHYRLGSSVRIWGPYSGRLDNGGERLELASPDGEILVQVSYDDDRGWPISPDGAGHSLVPREPDPTAQADGAYDYGRLWRPSTFIGGSPGQPNPDPERDLVISELMAHTDMDDPAFSDHDSNDWVEIVNVGSTAVGFDGWYLSDTLDDLARWPLPEGTLAPGERVVFDQIAGFHSPDELGFGLNKAGEELLLSHLRGEPSDRIADEVRFEGQANEISLGRLSGEGTEWLPLEPTPGSPNDRISPLWEGVVISEIMYHPNALLAGTDDAQAAEYLELHNTRSQPLQLSNETGSWRLAGGIRFELPAETGIAANESILVVGFDPADPVIAESFKETYDVPEETRIFGPYDGRLANNGENLMLQRPEAPDRDGDSIAWVIIDEVFYSDHAPWPREPDGQGDSLNRNLNARPGLANGNEPANWTAQAPSAGRAAAPAGPVDSDDDGMPDEWEETFGLDPHDPTDAAADSDGDGFSNHQELLAGTDPTDPESRLVIHRITTDGNTLRVEFDAAAGRAYELQALHGIDDDNAWVPIAEVPARSADEQIEVVDEIGDVTAPRFYRLKLKGEG